MINLASLLKDWNFIYIVVVQNVDEFFEVVNSANVGTLVFSGYGHSGSTQVYIITIGLRGEDTRPFLPVKRFRPVDKIKNIFFIFFSGFKRAKLNKKKLKKIFFRWNFLEKNLKNCLFSGQKHLFLGKIRHFWVFWVYFIVFISKFETIHESDEFSGKKHEFS